MTATTKNVNYTPEMIATLKENYIPTDTEAQRTLQVADLAELLERSVQSIRMKLTQLGIYVPLVKVKAEKKAKKPTRAELQTALELALEFEPDTLAGFERANAGSLQRVIDKVLSLKTQLATIQG